MEEMDQLAKRQQLTKLNQEKTENMNIPIRSNEIKTVIKNRSINKKQECMASQVNSIKYLKKS